MQPDVCKKRATDHIDLLNKHISFLDKKVLEIGACFGFDAKEMMNKGADVFCADINKNYLSYIKNNHAVPDDRIIFGKIQEDDERLKRDLLGRGLNLNAAGWNENFKTMNSIPHLVDVLKDEVPFDLLTIFRIAFSEKEGAAQLTQLVKSGGHLVIGYATEGEYECRLEGGAFDVLKQDFELEHTLFRSEIFKDYTQDSIHPDNAVWMIWQKK